MTSRYTTIKPKAKKDLMQLFISQDNKKMERKFYVVDADGNDLSNQKPQKESAVLYTPRRLSKKVARYADLMKLEDAIFNHGPPYRKKYLTILKNTKEIPNPDPDFPITKKHQDGRFERYLQTMMNPSREIQALRFCWEKLKWRPSEGGKAVMDCKNNPYVK